MAANPYTSKVKAVRIIPVTGEGSLRAFAAVQIGEALEIRSLRVVQQPGLDAWVSMPQQKRGDKWFDVVRPLDERLEEAISAAVLAAWRDSLIVGQGARRGDDVPF